MKITFLGTSHGVPNGERYCSSILIESGGAFYFIDAGAPIADIIQKRALSWQNFKAIFTTHAHGDHTAGIFQAADLINWYYKNCSADIFLTAAEQIEAYKTLIFLSNNSREPDFSRVRLSLAHEGEIFNDGNIRVEYIKNSHMTSTPSYSILIQAEEKRVLFSGDLSNGLRENDIPVSILESGVDAFICELAHFSFDELAPYIKNAKIGKMFITHVYPVSKYNDLENTSNTYHFEILTPNDGDNYEII